MLKRIIAIGFILLCTTLAWVILGGTILSALYWVTQRRREVAMAEAEEKTAINKMKERS